MDSLKIGDIKGKALSQCGFRAYTSNKPQITRDTAYHILASNIPIDLKETDEITVNGERGILMNKSEIKNWRGHFPISKYPINEDPNPKVIRKRTQQQIVYQQEVAIRYLRPPTPPAPGEIFIQQEGASCAPPPPPLVLRQQPARPITPPPLVVREAPPPPPPAVGRKVITISGKTIPPPPRKVIIERLPELPRKPQSIIIERWLPYKQIKRKVIFVRDDRQNNERRISSKPKNIIVQWNQPKVEIKKEFKDLGTVRANPIEYAQRFGSTLKKSDELPQFVKDIRPPENLVLAANDPNKSNVFELEGDIFALNFIDLEREGLLEYKNQLKSCECQTKSILSSSLANKIFSNTQIFSTSNLLKELYESLNKDKENKIFAKDANRILSRLKNRLTGFDKENLKDYQNYILKTVDANRKIDFFEFKNKFENLISNK